MKETYIFKEELNFFLEGDLYRTNREFAPLIIFIHGGGLIWGQKEELPAEVANYYNDNGYHVFSINYRLAPEASITHIWEDIEDSIKWVTTNASLLNIDKNRIAIVGHSAGGYLALSSGTFHLKPKAIISFYGYGDLTGSWSNHPSKHYLQNDLVSEYMANSLIQNKPITSSKVDERFLLYLYARQKGTWSSLLCNERMDILPKFSPILQVDQSYPPTLFIHGTNDKDVPFEQSAFMRAALVKNGVPTRLIAIPNGEHVFDKDFHSVAVQTIYQAVIEFLNNELK